MTTRDIQFEPMKRRFPVCLVLLAGCTAATGVPDESANLPAPSLELQNALAENRPIELDGLATGNVGARSEAKPVVVDDAMLEMIESLGFDSATAEPVRSGILVEGDIVLDPEVLRAGGYAPTHPGSTDADRTHKGYKKGPLVNSTHDGNIRLELDPSFTYTPDIGQMADFAAMQWSHNNSLDISRSNHGATINVWLLAPEDFFQECGHPRALACAEYPKNGRPGANIWMKSDITATNPCGWTPSILLRVLTHELGHAVGMAHPTPSDGTHIPGTDECYWIDQGVPGLCNVFPDPESPSIMYSGQGWYDPHECTPYQTFLSADDADSIQELYPHL